MVVFYKFSPTDCEENHSAAPVNDILQTATGYNRSFSLSKALLIKPSYEIHKVDFSFLTLSNHYV